jgi:hypothetical protein
LWWDAIAFGVGVRAVLKLTADLPTLEIAAALLRVDDKWITNKLM